MQHLSWQHLSMSRISQLLLARFRPNFKSWLMGPSWTDSKCHGAICPGNICPGDISGISQLILTRFWPNFKGRFLGPSITDVNYHRDIYLGNISRGKHAKSLFVSAQIFLHVQQKIQLFFLVFLWGIFSQSLMLSKSFPERYWKNGNFGEYLWKSWFPYWENGVFELCRTTTI